MRVSSQGLQSLFDGQLLIMRKDGEKEEDAGWNFAGIASDETEDIEGDRLLKSALDLTYAKRRGFVNWNHSREPGDQVGYLTKCELIEGEQLRQLSKSLNVELNKTATVYVEGSLYRYVPKAVEVRAILKSATPGYNGGLGISVDGMMAKSSDGSVVKAFVRGVALTPAPAHTSTLCHLKKALREFREQEGLTLEEAIKWCLDKRPNWSTKMAEMFVQRVAKARKE